MKNINSYSGTPFVSTLFFIFLVLKLCNVISWSWWWVTAPLWISVIVIIICGFIIGIATCHMEKEEKSS